MPILKTYQNEPDAILDLVKQTKDNAELFAIISNIVEIIANELKNFDVDNHSTHGYLQDIDKAFTHTYQGSMHYLGSIHDLANIQGPFYLRLVWTSTEDYFNKFIDILLGNELLLQYHKQGLFQARNKIIFIGKQKIK